MASEQIPPSSVVLVVEGGLRVTGIDSAGNEFTFVVLLRVNGGVLECSHIFSSASCRTTSDTKLLTIPVDIWL